MIVPGPTARPAHGAGVALCVGETMALLLPPTSWEDGDPSVRVSTAGAESNVAVGLARLDRAARWCSRVGDDPYGRLVIDSIGAAGVDLSCVAVDPDRPTGLMSKTHDEAGTRVRYYRRGSAAAALAPSDLVGRVTDDVAVCHLTGVTPALSGSTAELCDAVLRRRVLGSTMISFDVNHRPLLWDADRAAPRLRELADAADLVLVGQDEAQTLWGCDTPAEVRALLASPRRLVIKDGPSAATAYDGDRATVVPALRADVVEVVGAGDAFAAGFLAALLDGEDDTAALRLGHVMAALTIQSPLDLPPLPAAQRLRELARLDDAAWSRLHVTPELLARRSGGPGVDPSTTR